MRKLFGTDGIRGKANLYPMTGDIAFKLGQAIGVKLRTDNQTRVVIGKDTRLSGYIFEYSLTAGLCSTGVFVYLVGPMPTPAIAHLVRSFAADAGIVISASHNPAEDNGIKLFDSKGYKLADEVEHDIEKMIFSNEDFTKLIKPNEVGKAFRIADASGRYIEFAKGSINNGSLEGYKIVLDCANGAAYRVAPLIFKELGADVFIYGNKPDGLNINHECGALHTEVIETAVIAAKADIGIALDGDADRVMLVDETGKLIDGDQILGLCGLHLKKQNRLRNDTIVATVMSNMGFESAMKKKGLNFVRAPVGDRYVIEEMKNHDSNLGGEQSGHIIFSDFNSTGDGTMTALQVLNIMKQTGKKLSELAKVFTPFPQILENVRVKEKKPIDSMPKVKVLIDEITEEMKDTGRVLVRYSGTENKCRVMVEGTDEETITKNCKKIINAIKEEIGE